MNERSGFVHKKCDEDKIGPILIVHNYYQIPGGEDTVVANEKKMLESHGHRVVFYSRDNSELKEMSVLRKLALPFIAIFNLRTYQDIRKIIKKQKIKIVHVHNTLNLISPSVYYAALSLRIPVVQTVHNFRMICPGATFYRDGYICEDCAEKGLYCAIKNRCYRGSKLQTLVCVASMKIHRLMGTYGKLNYICLTEFNKDKLLKLKQVRMDKVFVKPNFTFNEADNKEKKRDIYTDIFEGNKDIDDLWTNQFLFVGRLDKMKGIEILLQAWNQMEKEQAENVPRLIVCGTGPMEEWCDKYIKENYLKSVKLFGFVQNEEIRKMMSECKAVILPTQCYEGFPMTIAEAYSVGTPVIGSSIGNTGNLIESGVSGICFSPTDIQELVDAVQKMQNKPLRVPLSIKERYSVESNYRNLIEIYKSCSSFAE